MKESSTVTELLTTLISMQAKTNAKMEYYHVRIRQLEHIIQTEIPLNPPSLTT